MFRQRAAGLCVGTHSRRRTATVQKRSACAGCCGSLSMLCVQVPTVQWTDQHRARGCRRRVAVGFEFCLVLKRSGDQRVSVPKVLFWYASGGVCDLRISAMQPHASGSVPAGSSPSGCWGRSSTLVLRRSVDQMPQTECRYPQPDWLLRVVDFWPAIKSPWCVDNRTIEGSWLLFSPFSGR